MPDIRLTDIQLKLLEKVFHLGAEEASHAMAKWLNVPSMIAIQSVEQLPVQEATSILGGNEDVVCFCIMEIKGSLAGHLILCFDDESGLSLADLLLDRPKVAVEWGDIERSAALESHNIIGCAYLNSLAKHLVSTGEEALELIPTPPEFRRDFAECLLQAVFMDQTMASESVFITNARFEIRGEPLLWTLLLVPDVPSLQKLEEILTRLSADSVKGSS